MTAHRSLAIWLWLVPIFYSSAVSQPELVRPDLVLAAIVAWAIFIHGRRIYPVLAAALALDFAFWLYGSVGTHGSSYDRIPDRPLETLFFPVFDQSYEFQSTIILLVVMVHWLCSKPDAREMLSRHRMLVAGSVLFFAVQVYLRFIYSAGTAPNEILVNLDIHVTVWFAVTALCIAAGYHRAFPAKTLLWACLLSLLFQLALMVFQPLPWGWRVELPTIDGLALNFSAMNPGYSRFLADCDFTGGFPEGRVFFLLDLLFCYWIALCLAGGAGLRAALPPALLAVAAVLWASTMSAFHYTYHPDGAYHGVGCGVMSYQAEDLVSVHLAGTALPLCALLLASGRLLERSWHLMALVLVIGILALVALAWGNDLGWGQIGFGRFMLTYEPQVGFPYVDYLVGPVLFWLLGKAWRRREQERPAPPSPLRGTSP